MDLIVMSHMEHITSRHGEVLQLRPKAANGKALTEDIGEQGQPILAMPRGFYLKKNFTGALLVRYFLIQISLFSTCLASSIGTKINAYNYSLVFIKVYRADVRMDCRYQCLVSLRYVDHS